jgi:hypothetical protein
MNLREARFTRGGKNEKVRAAELGEKKVPGENFLCQLNLAVDLKQDLRGNFINCLSRKVLPQGRSVCADTFKKRISRNS